MAINAAADRIRPRIRRIGWTLGLALALSAVAAAPVLADPWDRDGRGRHDGRSWQGDRDGRARYADRRDWDGRNWQQRQWKNQWNKQWKGQWKNKHAKGPPRVVHVPPRVVYARPKVVYAPPPVVYAPSPRVVYADRPGITIVLPFDFD